MRKTFMVVWTLFLLLVVFAGPKTLEAQTRIICASTTSTQNSGFFDYILPHFQRKTGIAVHVIAVGTGQALAIGRKGDADVLLVHDPESEAKFVAEGYGTDWHQVMYNDFVVLGPGEDPARIRGLKEAGRAFRQIGQGKATFVSRGDNSGTNKAELRIWKGAAIDPKGKKWYVETGQGMANTIRVANEKRGYTLSDRGTWLAVTGRQELDLAILVEGDRALFNQYGVIAVNPARHPHVKHREALVFINWLISPEGQKLIGSFRDRHGHQLFVPNAK